MPDIENYVEIYRPVRMDGVAREILASRAENDSDKSRVIATIRARAMIANGIGSFNPSNKEE